MQTTTASTKRFTALLRSIAGANGRAVLVLLAVAQSFAASARAEDGYQLWLRYVKVGDPGLLAQYRRAVTQIVVPGQSSTAKVTRDELQRAMSGLLDEQIPCSDAVMRAGAIVVRAPDASAVDLAGVQGDGYRLFTEAHGNTARTIIAARTSIGGLYGAFAFIRLVQTNQRIDHLNVVSQPAIARRMLNHWDNPGSHRAGLGESLWFSHWSDLPGKVDPRLIDYARANASVGINGTVINDVNAKVILLESDQLQKVAALAQVFRPYGLHVYLSVNLASPIKAELSKGNGIGDLDTADPLDPAVAQWWKAKTDEIYSLIPDFGGFLVKADSEGMPGPKQYHRSETEAANMLAAALAPHGGLLMWRAFVYDQDVDPDRAKRSYKEFKPLDGQFAANAMLQVKNGPLDFQPNEPVHPLWGAMPKTQMILEFQIMQEYLGRSTDLVYLGEEWQHVLQTNTFGPGAHPTVARIVEGSVHPQAITGIAGVANIGNSRDWCGHPFAQANWYAFARLAWNPSLKADAIAEEWARMTWSNSPAVVTTVVTMMKGSWQAAVDVRGPLGLNFTSARDHHHSDPAARVDNYWFADTNGVGYDRTNRPESGWKGEGSDATSQYFEPLQTQYNDVHRCPEEYLLWFHFVPWDYKMQSGQSLWAELTARYRSGAAYVGILQREWASLDGRIDADRFQVVREKLDDQAAFDNLWLDTSLEFFTRRSGRSVSKSKKAVD